MESLRENDRKFMKNIRLTLRSQQRFERKKHNVFTEEVNKTALSANDDKRIKEYNQSILQKHMHMEQAKV